MYIYIYMYMYMYVYVCIYIYIYIYTYIHQTQSAQFQGEWLKIPEYVAACLDLKAPFHSSVGKLKVPCDVIVVNPFSHQAVVFE